MSTPSVYLKDPEAVLDYHFEWEEWLVEGDSIATYEVSVPVGGELVLGTVLQVGTLISYWLSGGLAGESYQVTCKIVTTQGRTESRSKIIRGRVR